MGLAGGAFTSEQARSIFMRTALLLVRKHGSEKFELAAGPEMPLMDQRGVLRELLASNGVHGEYAEAQLWESDSGVQRTVKFKTEEDAQAAAAQAEKDNAAMLAAQKDAGKGEPKKDAGKGSKKGK